MEGSLSASSEQPAWLDVAPADLDGAREQDGDWESSPASPKHPEVSHLLHQLPQLSTPAISGAGTLGGDHRRADAFPIGGLGRSIQLPAFLWALEEGLWGGQGLESRNLMGETGDPEKQQMPFAGHLERAGPGAECLMHGTLLYRRQD